MCIMRRISASARRGCCLQPPRLCAPSCCSPLAAVQDVDDLLMREADPTGERYALSKVLHTLQASRGAPKAPAGQSGRQWAMQQSSLRRAWLLCSPGHRPQPNR